MVSSQRFDFPNASGQTLSGRLELPDGPPRAFAIFAHCFTCSKNIAAAGRIGRALAARGIAVLRFDFTGLGNSEGDFANTTFSSNIEDLVAAADRLREVHRAPTLLVGHSLGGAAVLAAAPRISEVRAIATLAAPSDLEHLEHLLGDGLADLKPDEAIEVVLGGQRFRIGAGFVVDLKRHPLTESLPNLGRALLVFHSPTDEVVGIDHARRLFEAARHPKSFISLEGADHLLSRPEDSDYVAATLSAWAGRYLPIEPSSEPAPAAPEEGRVRVSSAGGPFRQEVWAGRHVWIADEPKRVGGEDAGPTPYDHLLAALGTCTSMTLAMYARHKQWPLEGVTVELEHDRIHVEDCEDCESSDGQIDRIRRVIQIRGDRLDAEQRQRLLEIADRCPVHRTLTNDIRIETEVGEID